MNEEITKYPIEPGIVLKLKQPMRRYNSNLPATSRLIPGASKKSKIYVEHTVYIWIQSIGLLEDGRQPKERNYTVAYTYIPNLTGLEEKYFTKVKRNRKVSICKSLKDFGYEIIGNVKYDSKKEHWIDFYKLIGLI